MFSLFIARRLGLATPPAPSPNHGGERLFQGVSASKTAARVISFLAASALALLLLASPGRAGPQFIVAPGGYDAVAYQTPGEAVQGRNEHAFFWNGATWLFSSEANRDAFAANPERFAPLTTATAPMPPHKATRHPARLLPGASWTASSM
jgi:YHS domain-containing protein